MKYQSCASGCGNTLSQSYLDQNQVSVYGRHVVNLKSNQTYLSNVDVRSPTTVPVFASTGSVLFFQHYFQQNIYNGRVAVELNAAYSDYKANCTPVCFSNYKLGEGQSAPEWRYLLRAITAPLKSSCFYLLLAIKNKI